MLVKNKKCGTEEGTLYQLEFSQGSTRDNDRNYIGTEVGSSEIVTLMFGCETNPDPMCIQCMFTNTTVCVSLERARETLYSSQYGK